MKQIAIAVAAATLVVSLSAAAALAGAPMIAKAKQAGFPAQNCQYCHVSKLPKKEAFKPEDLNERGQWLLAEKTKQNAKDIDVEWLKNYPGGPEQK